MGMSKGGEPVIKFFRVLAPGQVPGTVVIVAEDTEASFLLLYVPNTGLSHRRNELSNDFLFGDDGGTYEPISADEAAELIGDVAPFDERRDVARRLLARCRPVQTIPRGSFLSDWSRRQQPLGLDGLEMRINDNRQSPASDPSCQEKGQRTSPPKKKRRGIHGRKRGC